MPRLNINRIGEFTAGTLTVPSNTETDIGASAGVGFTSESGASAHLAIDWLSREGGSPFGFSLGVHYIVGG